MDALQDSMTLAGWLAMSATEQEETLNLLWETVKDLPKEVENRAKSNFYGMLDAYRGIDPDKPSHRQFSNILFNFFAKRLDEFPDDEKHTLDVLYDIGKWQHSYPEKAREIVMIFVESHDNLSQEVNYNAKRAMDGTYLSNKLCDTFVEKIQRAFSDVPYPEDGRIVDDKYHCYECEEMHNAFVGRQWQSLTDATYLRWHKETSLFTPASFRCFLPAFMRAAVVDPDEADLVSDYIVYALTPPSEAQDELNKANEMRFDRKLRYTDEQRAEQNRWKAQRLKDFKFNHEQLEVICDYLRLYVQLYEPYYDLALSDALPALGYWQNQLQSTL